MPFHKHKKRKKSHKHQKKRASSSSDEDSLWKVNVTHSDSDSSKDDKKLTSLVRKLYVNHLEQALAQNIEAWNYNEQSEEIVRELAKKWSSVLEQKCLKACMISELYRKSMIALIKEIKESTSGGRLYIKENTVSSLKLKLPLTKGIQTDVLNIEPKLCEAETQTDPPPHSLLELPLPSTVTFSPTSRPYDPAIDFSDSQSSDGGVSSSFEPKTSVPNISSTNQDVCNITSTSDLFDSVSFVLLYEDRNSIKKVTDPMSVSDLDTKYVSEHLQSNEKQTTEVVLPCREGDVKSKRSEISDILGQKHAASEHVLSKSDSKDNLDARLNAMGLFNAVDSISGSTALSDVRSKKNNWYAEEIAQSCNLTRVLLGMSTKERERVMKKIKVLFGDEDEPLTELSEENLRVCRKRIASVVVMELTPIYQSKKIASRHLFKFLAKKITKSLMQQSYAPDTRSIRWKVKEFFTDGKVIMSESDCI